MTEPTQENSQEDVIDLDRVDLEPEAPAPEQPEPAATPEEVEVVPEATPNYTVRDGWRAPLSKFSYNADYVILPAATASAMEKKIEESAAFVSQSGEEIEDYLRTIGESFGALPHGNVFESASRRPEANWAFEIPSSVGMLAGKRPSFMSSADTQYTGDKARLLARSALNLGTVFQVPLWHSGFWVTIKALGDDQLLEAERRIMQERQQLGRQTYGQIFSNTMAFTNETLLDLVLRNVYDTSLNVKRVSDIREYIRLPDLHALIWGMACATWAGGFQYRRACVADPASCNHVIEEKVNLGVLQATDKSILTENQIKHMTSRKRGSMSVDSVKNYVSEFKVGLPKQYVISDELSVVLRTPMIDDHISSGRRWANTIEETYAQAMTMEPAERQAFLNNQARATLLREYAHYVESINIKGAVFTDTPTVEQLLNDFSERDDLRVKITEAVRTYLDDTLVSFIAIPTYECPSCGGKQPTTNHARFPELIPIDVTNVFFQLMVRRIGRIMDRVLAPTWAISTSD